MGVTFSALLKFEQPDRSKFLCSVCRGKEHRYDCPECDGQGFDWQAYETAYAKLSPGEMHLSNANARALLAWLGLPETPDGDIWGQCTPQDMRRGIIIAAAVRDPEPYTRPAYDNHGIELTPEGVSEACRVIECGLPASRFARYAAQLLVLCDIAEKHNTTIIWG